ncbi:hypothetical protein FIBSPDRAFT_1047045 [Athelia psychrophila]|uniref:Uncharacterized protein n=1 Tax=Athelia psychrophila TaxID=1759441 RepID=A0A166FRD2_9AGAM|nr:hypothetical protein FIBSPDRAFT_1047045 [Fibularhizoctonia sp. CBS 109695]
MPCTPARRLPQGASIPNTSRRLRESGRLAHRRPYGRDARASGPPTSLERRAKNKNKCAAHIQSTVAMFSTLAAMIHDFTELGDGTIMHATYVGRSSIGMPEWFAKEREKMAE